MPRIVSKNMLRKNSANSLIYLYKIHNKVNKEHNI